jgi:DNA polymerase sigma
MIKYRDLVIQRLRYIVQSIFDKFNSVDIILYGSQANGLSLANSDIDLLVAGLPTDSQRDMGRHLQTLLENLLHFKWIKDYKPIFTAQVPVKNKLKPIFNSLSK